MVIKDIVSNASRDLNLSNDTDFSENVFIENDTDMSGSIKLGINIRGEMPCP